MSHISRVTDSLTPIPDRKTIFGSMEVERHVTHRCTHQREHHALTPMVTCDHQESPHLLNADDRFCVNPRHVPVLPIPCDECYSIESFWRRIPWEPDSTTQAAITVTPLPVGSGDTTT